MSMYDDTGMKFSDNFGCRKIYQEISCMFVGTSIGMSVYPGNIFFMEFGHSKNSKEMLDQKYHGHTLVSSS